MMKRLHTGFYRNILPVLALLSLFPVTAAAQSGLQWYAGTEDNRISLAYGYPGFPHPWLSFSCVPDGGGLTFKYRHEPVEAYDGVEVRLRYDDIEIPVMTFGTRLALDSDLYLFEGRLEANDRFVDMITSPGTLRVRAEQTVREYPLEGVREAAAPLIESCRGQPVETDVVDIKPCTISAWSTDETPDGLPVHKGSGADTPVTGTLPPPVETEGYTFRTEVSITGSKNGWFRIDRGTVVNYIGDEPDEIVFDGEGWVPGRALGLLVNDHILHTKPAFEAQTVAELLGSKEGMAYGPDSFRVDHLHACVGHWVEVGGNFMGSRHRGWSTGTCSNQVTTCP